MSAAGPPDSGSVSAVGRAFLGRPADWRLTRPPRLHRPRSGAHWVGPIVVVSTVLVGWFAFAGAVGEDGSADMALFAGAAAISSMAWSFVLAVRVRWMERWFGGLDRIYRVHRWTGAVAVVAMFLHTQMDPELEQGIAGASDDMADLAQELAGVAEILLYVLVGLSVVRWLPTRYWRWTHKFLGVPFVFASFHFVTAEKPYANSSPWGVWFAVVMTIGTVAWLFRIVGRDALWRGVRHRVTSVEHRGTTTRLELMPSGRRRVRHRNGQFAFVKVQAPGLREPHPFTIASDPAEPVLRFYIRDLGDWTRRMRRDLTVGTEVLVEGPYGRLRPLPRRAVPTLWVAGGVGITPFIAAASHHDASQTPAPHLFYAVRSRDDASALDELERADREGRIRLHLHSSADGTRLEAEELRRVFGPNGLRGAHVVMCGPGRLVHQMSAVARELGARQIEIEDFDIRQGIGPDVSLVVDDLVRRAARP